MCVHTYVLHALDLSSIAIECALSRVESIS
jgi:hypothetical protein